MGVKDGVKKGKWLKENIKRCAAIFPQIAPQIAKADLQASEWFECRNGEQNLLIDGEPLHARYSASKEAEKLFADLKLGQSSEECSSHVIYVYGVGLGYLFDAAQNWLKENPSNYLVFIEDDLRVLHRLFETERGTHILDHKQVQVHYFDRLDNAEPMVHWLTWYFIQAQIEITALPSYERDRAPVYNQLRSWMAHEAVQRNSMVAEYLRHGGAFFHNFYANILHLHESYSGNELFGKFEGVPAIICGAGPSLNKSMPLLKKLSKKALILAGGSSVNALSAEGIIPHFGGGIDPNPPQLQRIISNQAYELPYFYRGRMFHKAFQAIRGARLYITGTGGYNIAEWFEDRLGIQHDGQQRGSIEEIDEGHNVITFLMDIARRLGCGPIIFIGMDLAYTDLQAYASGVVGDSTVEEKDILANRDLDSNAFPRTDINGNQVYTLWKWVNEAQWISDWAKGNSNIQVFNATGGGIGFEGIPNRSLEELLEKELAREWNLDGQVHAAIQNAAMPNITADKVQGSLADLQSSLKRFCQICIEMMDEIDAMSDRLKQGKMNLKRGAGQSEKAEELEEKLKKEPAFDYVVGIFNDVFTKVQHRQLQEVKHDWRLRSDCERNLQRFRINKEKFSFLLETAKTNLDIIRDVINDHQQAGYCTEAFEAAKEEVSS